jgi:hypothetical protein
MSDFLSSLAVYYLAILVLREPVKDDYAATLMRCLAFRSCWQKYAASRALLG